MAVDMKVCEADLLKNPFYFKGQSASELSGELQFSYLYLLWHFLLFCLVQRHHIFHPVVPTISSGTHEKHLKTLKSLASHLPPFRPPAVLDKNHIPRLTILLVYPRLPLALLGHSLVLVPCYCFLWQFAPQPHFTDISIPDNHLRCIPEQVEFGSLPPSTQDECISQLLMLLKETFFGICENWRSSH